MKLRLSLKYIVAFSALLFVMHELHEIAHTATGRIICGCWGQRDFNVWSLCAGCSENSNVGLLATLAGPFFTYLMIWSGFIMLKHDDQRFRSFGFSIIFANMPFARLLSALLNSGDETYMLQKLGMDSLAANTFGSLIVFAIIMVPLARAFSIIQNKNKLLWFICFLVLPVMLDIVVMLGLMNTLLVKGLFEDYWVLGSPVLVTAWTSFVVLAVIFTYKRLFGLFQNVLR